MELPSARPYAFRFRPEATALVVIDMQRDFVDPNGFGSIQCGDEKIFSQVRNLVPAVQKALEASRKLGLHIVHTREGHKPDLSDLPASKRLRQLSAPSGRHTIGIGDEGPMGRLLVRGEYGHDIIDELQARPGEVVIDKPGKGSFWATTLHRALLARGITHLLFAGVTTECCVSSTVREASDRGFECCVLSDCTGGFDASFVQASIDMVCSFDGLYGYVESSTKLLEQIVPDDPTLKSPLGGLSDSLSISEIRQAYRRGIVTPEEVARMVARKTTEYQKKDPSVWIHLETEEALLSSARALQKQFAGKPLPPLYGIPFAVKDSIDFAGIRTTVSSESYAYTPKRHAVVVEALLEAGALFVGKTNLDQLATGLSGCRSPFGTPRSVYGNDRISGGSSSGSSVAVGARLVSFALGTDTAGSGRVPAAYNGVVGFKPTIGTLSSQGLVPACKSLDTVSVLAQTVEEARTVWLVVDQGPDERDAHSKPQSTLPVWKVDFRGPRAGGFTFGVPPASIIEGSCTKTYQRLFAETTDKLQKCGGKPQVVPWEPFAGATDLLYNGSLVLERIACIGPDFFAKHMDTLHPVIAQLFTAVMNRDTKPWDVFQDRIRQKEYTRQAEKIFEAIDVLVVPTTPCHPTIAEMEKDPIALNSKVGEFAHFANVLDLCGVNVPAATYREEVTGEVLPFGVTLLAGRGMDGKVFDVARELEREVLESVGGCKV